MKPVVEARNLRFQYDSGFVALRGVDFHLQQGESVAVLGPNGSGKTTFLLHLNGILRGEGELRICGLPMETRHFREIRRKVAFWFKDPEDKLFRPTVLAAVCFGRTHSGLARAEAELRAAQALRQVGFLDGWDRPPYQLSGGEKQRVALAGILAMDPEILVLDEPTTHLDPPARRHLAELLAELPQAKIVVTHDTAFARLLCPRAVFFDAGKVASDGPVAEVIREHGWES